MKTKKTVSILVLAAGAGTRIGNNPKAFLADSSKTLLEHAVEELSCIADEIIVGLGRDGIENGRNLLSSHDVSVVEGGDTRLETIEILVEASTKDILVIHDVARPEITIELFHSIIQAAIKHDASSTYIPASIRDGVALKKGDFYSASLDIDDVILTQTPQAFRRHVLLDAFQNISTHGWNESSPTAIAIKSGYKVRLVKGNDDNIKITYPEDLIHLNKVK